VNAAGCHSFLYSDNRVRAPAVGAVSQPSCRSISETAGRSASEGSPSVLHHLATTPVDRQHSSATALFALTAWATLIVLVWLLPAIVAFRRRVHNAGSIVVLSLFFGWMPVVWVLCLALACGSAPVRPSRQRRRWRRKSAPQLAPWPPPPPPYPVAVIVVATHPEDAVTHVPDGAGFLNQRLTAGKWCFPRCVAFPRPRRPVRRILWVRPRRGR
jgi:hypothetical protein